MIKKEKHKKYLFFFVYQEQEFHNYFPTALELKKKIINCNITFVFTNPDKYKEIVKCNEIKRKLKKNFNLYVYKHGNIIFENKIYSVLNRLNFLLSFITFKQPIFFFPRLSMLNQKFIFFFSKLFGGKIIYLSPDRFCQSISLMRKEQFHHGFLAYKKNIKLFDYFVFFQKDNFFYKNIRNFFKSDKKILNIGLPNLFSTWRTFINENEKIIKKNLLKKYKKYSSIYTIIGGKNHDSQFLKNNSSQYNSLSKILASIQKFDRNSIIFFKTHPKQPMPKYLKDNLIKVNKKRFIITSINPDILSKISKRLFFTAPSGILTHVQNVGKVDFSDYKEIYEKEFKKIHFAEGHRVVSPSLKNLSSKSLKRIFLDDNFFKKKKNYLKEFINIKKNSPNIDELINKI